MQRKVDITRGDIVRFNVAKFFGLKSNLYMLLFSLVAAAVLAFASARTDGGELVWLVFFTLTGVVTVALFLVMFVVGLAIVLVNSTVTSGVLGRHTYPIEDAAIRERTEANDTLNYWHAIARIEKTRAAILVPITPWLLHVLPRRGFESEKEFDALFNEIASRTGRH